MEKYVPRRSNDIEFSVSAVDYLIKDLIEYLKKEHLYENTAIFLFPDHTFTGTSDEVYNKLEKSPRGLYLLTNAPSVILPKKPSQTLYQIELPKMILAGAGIKTNAKFLADFIAEKDINSYLEKNIIKLTALNNASIVKENFASGIDLEIKKDFIILKSKTSTIHIPRTKDKYILEVVFNANMDYQKYRWGLASSAFMLHHPERDGRFLHLIISLDHNGTLQSLYLGDKKAIGLYKTSNSITAKEVDSIIKANKIDIKDPKLINHFNHYANKYIHNSKRFIARLGGMIDSHKNTNSLEALSSSYNLGFRNFELSFLKTSDSHYVAANSWKEWKQMVESNISTPPTLKQFKELKILGKYTPMDMDKINNFFMQHKDANLYALNIEDPEEFSKKFIDKSRLNFELTSIANITTAIKLNLNFMTTVKTYMDLNASTMKYIKQVKVRPQITYLHKNRADHFLNHKIQMFAYDLESDPGKSIEYILCHTDERKYFYGMFVYTWDFNSTVDCSKFNRDISNPHGSFWER